MKPAAGKKPEIARGLGPAPMRLALVGLALVYFVMLLKHPIPNGWIRPVAFFSECTGLFTQADDVASEYRLAGWSCDRKQWEPLDPRPYFPMRADDKEARFQRLGHFYAGHVDVLHPLGEYIVDHHAEHADDGVSGAIGGIQLVKISRPIPAPGSEIARYEYDPLGPVPADATSSLIFESSPRSLRTRCKVGHAAPAVPATDDKEVVPVGSDPWASP